MDCVIVGYNEVDFDEFVNAQRAMDRFSGAYREAKYNSVLLGGKRVTYMDLMNHVITEATGVNPQLNVFEVPSLGVCHLASFVRRRGYDARIINFVNKERDRFTQYLAEEPNAVAITTTYYVDPAPIIDLVKFIRKHSQKTRIVVGGPHIYNLCAENDPVTQDYIFQSIGADIYIFDAQGEGTFASVLEALRQPSRDLSGIPNLVYTEDNQTFHRTPRKVEDNPLDANSVAWEHFDEPFYSLPIYMRTALSCPFACSFCNFPAMAGEHRLASVDVIERELRYLADKGVKQMVFIDDTFNVPLPRFKELLRRMIRNRFDFKWVSFFRCSNADEEAFDLMKESGCAAVFLGVESGDQTILNNMAKFAKIDRYRYGIRCLNERGIATYASIICGFPGETSETVMNTIGFLEEARPTFFNVQLYYHDIRTPIHQQVKKYNIRGAGYSWQHASMDWKEAAGWAEYMFRNIRGSIPLTLYGFSIWALPYLMSKGISLPQMERFGAGAREILVGSFDDVETDFSEPLSRLASIFRPSA